MSFIKDLCVLGILFGGALSITPEGAVKRMMELACTAALTMTVLLPLKEMDFDSYALELAKYREKEMQLSESGTDASERLNRLVIEKEYETYIFHKAMELGIENVSVKLELKWGTDGLWIPARVSLTGEGSAGQRSKLTDIIETELGIPESMQEWSGDGRD